MVLKIIDKLFKTKEQIEVEQQGIETSTTDNALLDGRINHGASDQRVIKSSDLDWLYEAWLQILWFFSTSGTETTYDSYPEDIEDHILLLSNDETKNPVYESHYLCPAYQKSHFEEINGIIENASTRHRIANDECTAFWFGPDSDPWTEIRKTKMDNQKYDAVRLDYDLIVSEKAGDSQYSLDGDYASYEFLPALTTLKNIFYYGETGISFKMTVSQKLENGLENSENEVIRLYDRLEFSGIDIVTRKPKIAVPEFPDFSYLCKLLWDIQKFHTPIFSASIEYDSEFNKPIEEMLGYVPNNMLNRYFTIYDGQDDEQNDAKTPLDYEEFPQIKGDDIAFTCILCEDNGVIQDYKIKRTYISPSKNANDYEWSPYYYRTPKYHRYAGMLLRDMYFVQSWHHDHTTQRLEGNGFSVQGVFDELEDADSPDYEHTYHSSYGFYLRGPDINYVWDRDDVDFEPPKMTLHADMTGQADDAKELKENKFYEGMSDELVEIWNSSSDACPAQDAPPLKSRFFGCNESIAGSLGYDNVIFFFRVKRIQKKDIMTFEKYNGAWHENHAVDEDSDATTISYYQRAFELEIDDQPQKANKDVIFTNLNPYRQDYKLRLQELFNTYTYICYHENYMSLYTRVPFDTPIPTTKRLNMLEALRNAGDEEAGAQLDSYVEQEYVFSELDKIQINIVGAVYVRKFNSSINPGATIPYSFIYGNNDTSSSSN